MPTGGASLTSYPQGFAGGLLLRGVPLLQTHPGTVFWVSNSPIIERNCVAGSDGGAVSNSNNTGTFQRPFATIKQALSVTTDGAGDLIIVKPGHAEYVSNATGLMFNSAGVAIIGLGSGPLRPTLTYDTATTANIPVQSANMSLQNFLVKCNFAAVASAFTGIGASVTASIAAGPTTTGAIAGSVMSVTVVGSGVIYPGASVMGTSVVPGTIILSQISGTTGGVGTYLLNLNYKAAVTSGTLTMGTHDFNLEGCEFRDLSSALNLVTAYTSSSTANGSDGFRMAGCRFSSLGTTAATTAVVMAAAQDRVQLLDNYGNWAALSSTATLLAAGANAMTNLDCGRNRVTRPSVTQTTSGLLISCTSTACTGHVYDNYAENLASTNIICNTGTKLFFTQNFSMITGAADKSGLINPAAV